MILFTEIQKTTFQKQLLFSERTVAIIFLDFLTPQTFAILRKSKLSKK
jgi:hypothetical protein